MATQGNDILDGTIEPDAIDGLDGADRINGLDAVDTLSGGGGNDVIFGGDGDDFLYGFGAVDTQPGSGAIVATRVASGLSRPIFAVSAPGDPDRMFVVEQHTGAIRILDLATNTVAPAPFLDLPAGEIALGSEQGLLGLAFHPDYATNGKFYINLTNAAGDIEVWEYTRSLADPDVADVSSKRLILTFDHPPETNHNGGWLAFGPDGYLYISSGDGGGFGDPGNNAQNINSLLGKILRIDVNGDDFPGNPSANYAIPAGNPFVGVNGADEVWAYGLRNPWRPSFDSVTGDMYIADVGQLAIEELDYIAAGTPPGLNFGWHVMEGDQVFDGDDPGNPPPGDPSLVAPILQYPHVGAPNGGFSITGGYVNHGPGGAQGVYFFGDFVTGQIWTTHVVNGQALDFINRTAQLQVDAGNVNQIASFALDGDGRLYVVGLDGEIHRLTPGAAASDGADFLSGGAGNDTLEGGIGLDTADFSDKAGAVVVTLNGAISVTATVAGVAEDTLRNIENVVGGSGNDTLTGDGLANVFKGNGGADTLNGAGGSDTADFSDKTASLYLVLNGATATSVLVGGVAEDSIRDFENVIGGAGPDSITGDANANQLFGGGGNDFLRGGVGNDVIDGGGGMDAADFRDKAGSVFLVLNGASNAVAKVGGVDEDTVRNAENVFGGSGPDALTGDAFANILLGGDGNDFLSGGGGADVLDGGANTDAADFRDKTSGIAFTLNGAANAIVKVGGLDEDTIRNIENVFGGAGDDTMIGDAGANVFIGDAGFDFMRGGGGSDVLDGGAGGDDTADYSDKTSGIYVVLNEATNAVVKVGGVNEDTIRNIEVVSGSSSGDSMTGDALANVLIGGGGNDFLRGGGGADLIDGGAGVGDVADYRDKAAAVAVTLNGANNAVVTVGGVMEDTVRNAENVYGGSGSDTLTGDGAVNVLLGGGGDDRLAGMLSGDFLDGGSGLDTFVFNAGLGINNVDSIVNYNVADDTIELASAIFTGLAGGALAAGAFNLGVTATESDDRILFDAGSGRLFFDQDGLNGVAAKHFATLGAGLAGTVNSGEFFVV